MNSGSLGFVSAGLISTGFGSTGSTGLACDRRDLARA